MEATASERANVYRSFCRRSGDGLRTRAGRTRNALGVGRAPCEVRTGAAHRKDAGDPLRAVCARTLRQGRASATGDVRLSGLHAHLCERTGRTLPTCTAHFPPKAGCQDASATPRAPQAAARPGTRPTPLVT